MTLKEAQKKWDDAILMKVTHKANSVSAEELIRAASGSWNVPIKVLFVKVGVTSSRLIYSRQAAKEEKR